MKKCPKTVTSTLKRKNPGSEEDLTRYLVGSRKLTGVSINGQLKMDISVILEVCMPSALCALIAMRFSLTINKLRIIRMTDTMQCHYILTKLKFELEKGKKKTAEASKETPATENKAKLTPQKSGPDGKKGGNTHTVCRCKDSAVNENANLIFNQFKLGFEAVKNCTIMEFVPMHASNIEKKLESLPSMVGGVWSDDNALQLEAITQFRKLLSIERSPTIKEVIASDVVPKFVEFLFREDFPQLQAVWTLGNVAGDSPKCRDLVLSDGALISLLSQLNGHAKLSILRNASWTLSNFCRGKPQPPFEQTKPAIPALERLIHSTDEEVLTDACWVLSYLSDGTIDKIQAVIEANVCVRLVELFLNPYPLVLSPAWRTVGNIVTGDDIQTQCIISHQALPCLLNLLTHNNKKSIKKEACWTISNITAGNKEEIQIC